MVTEIPEQYSWLISERGPKILLEAVKLYGTLEVVGDKDNPEILNWAKELGLPQYTHDSIPWCGLFVALVASRAGKEVVKDPLWAANWLNFGSSCEGELGAVAVFSREGGNHVGIYVGEDSSHYHILGGNQKDSVSIVRISKSRCRGFRAQYRSKPTNVRRVILSATGEVSTNEA